MATFAEVFASLKDEFLVRYRSPIWGATLLSLSIFHWKIIVFFITGKPTTSEAISFIETNISIISVLSSFCIALIYVVAFPWLELVIARLASTGKRKRNDFHIDQHEREINRRKQIAMQHQEALDIEIQNKINESKRTDIELVKSYQKILWGENFNRWMKDIKMGAMNSQVQNSIINYMDRVDTVEGKFNNPIIEEAHAKFVEALSALGSAISNSPSGNPSIEKLTSFSQNAFDAHQHYRQKVREILEF